MHLGVNIQSCLGRFSGTILSKIKPIRHRKRKRAGTGEGAGPFLLPTGAIGREGDQVNQVPMTLVLGGTMPLMMSVILSEFTVPPAPVVRTYVPFSPPEAVPVMWAYRAATATVERLHSVMIAW